MIEIKNVVCDYGIYEGGELKLILNSRYNALLIKRILEIDSLCNRGDYYATADKLAHLLV